MATDTTANRENDTRQQELILFAEKDEALACIASLQPLHERQDDEKTPHVEGSSSVEPATRYASLQRLREIFDKYLECPTLLDPSLEGLVQRLAAIVLSCRSLSLAINHPRAKDHTDTQDLQYPLSALYSLSKVRGYKTVSRFLPHGVEQVEVVWQAMRQCKHYEQRLQYPETSLTLETTHTPPIWESIYMLRHWLSTLSLVPFDEQVFDNTDVEHGFSVERLLQSTRNELEQAGPVREAAASCLASWLSRPDAEQRHLPAFVQWTQVVVQEFITSAHSSLHGNLLFRLMGSLQVHCILLKRSSVARHTLIQLLQPLWDPLLVLANSADRNLLLHKLLNKWWTRMSCAHLPPRLALWRYQRGQRSLGEKTTQIVTRSQASAAPAKASAEPTNDTDDDLFDVPDMVEDATGRLLEALGHASTVVRWSAAKGIGRVTERLPELCAEDVLDALLDMFQDYEKDQAWHGACLTLAELARRGLLLPHRLDDVIPLVVKAVHYDLRRGNTSVGAYVRDAACYTFWAFARAYSPHVLRDFIKPLAVAVVLTSLFDREVNCRRAASAAFQEAVGRQGALNFPNGIAIITLADFFSLGNRKEAYTAIAAHVAHFDEYRVPIFKHLYEVKLFHWDINIRKLAAQSLAQLSKHDPVFLANRAIPFLAEKSLDSTSVIIRHGAVLGVAELTKALAEEDARMAALTDENTSLIVELVGEIDKRRLYRGRGGEIMRSACCRLIECISLAKLTLTVKHQLKMLDTVDACISHPSDEIQNSACKALGHLMASYFPVGEAGPSARLQSRVVDKFIKQLRTSPNVAVSRGYALALGFLPAKLVAPSASVLGRVFVALRETARPDAKVGNEGDAETRRNALLSFDRIIQTIQCPVGNSTPCRISTLDEKHVKGVLEVYLNSLNDYNSDRRGDVGSWCRMAALSGLANLMTGARPKNGIVDWTVDAATPTMIVGEFLKQMGERLDAVRLHAGEKLGCILEDTSLLVQHKAKIHNTLQLQRVDHRWADVKVVFTNLLKVAVLAPETLTVESENKSAGAPYFDRVIAGVILCAGGMTSTTSKEAIAALINFAKVSNGTKYLDLLGETLLDLMDKKDNDTQFVVSTLKSIEELLLYQCCDTLVQQSESSFASNLCHRLEKELIGCADVKRLMLIADVSVALLRSLRPRAESEQTGVDILCSLLKLPYPRVRTHVSQHLYLILQDLPHLIEKGNDVLEMIVETPWGSEMSGASVQETVAGITEQLGLSKFTLSEPVVQ